VLEPVDTSDWSVDTIDEHVAAVRNMFLKAMGQNESDRLLTATQSSGDPRSKPGAAKKTRTGTP